MAEMDKLPRYIVHSDGDDTKNEFAATDGSGHTIVINVGEQEATINDVKFYSETKINELLNALETRLNTKITDTDKATRAWATSTFAPK